MDKQVWKPCANQPSYKCNREGQIKGPHGQIMKPQNSGHGYSAIKVHSKSTLVHRIIAETWLPNPENHPHITHLDGNKWNNSVDNLAWVKKRTGKYGPRCKVIKGTNFKTGAIYHFRNQVCAAQKIGCTAMTVKYMLEGKRSLKYGHWILELSDAELDMFEAMKVDYVTQQELNNYNDN
jgi:hypothetical protein